MNTEAPPSRGEAACTPWAHPSAFLDLRIKFLLCFTELSIGVNGTGQKDLDWVPGPGGAVTIIAQKVEGVCVGRKERQFHMLAFSRIK